MTNISVRRSIMVHAMRELWKNQHITRQLLRGFTHLWWMRSSVDIYDGPRHPAFQPWSDSGCSQTVTVDILVGPDNPAFQPIYYSGPSASSRPLRRLAQCPRAPLNNVKTPGPLQGRGELMAMVARLSSVAVLRRCMGDAPPVRTFQCTVFQLTLPTLCLTQTRRERSLGDTFSTRSCPVEIVLCRVSCSLFPPSLSTAASKSRRVANCVSCSHEKHNQENACTH